MCTQTTHPLAASYEPLNLRTTLLSQIRNGKSVLVVSKIKTEQMELKSIETILYYIFRSFRGVAHFARQ